MARRIVMVADAARCGLFGICGCDDARSFRFAAARETKQQASIGTQIDKDELLPGDLVFFKTGSGQNGCM